MKGTPRIVWRYDWQEAKKEVEVYTDSDWAGCMRTRKSTSGGVIKVGRHIIKAWATTQKTVALSSGEAEMVAAVKGIQEGIGIKAMLKEWGEDTKVVALCDSTAAIGIVNRKGVGKLRHIDVSRLWVQDLREEGKLDMKKVLGTQNPADQLTKYLGVQDVAKGLRMLDMEPREGRPEIASGVKRGIEEEVP